MEKDSKQHTPPPLNEQKFDGQDSDSKKDFRPHERTPRWGFVILLLALTVALFWLPYADRQAATQKITYSRFRSLVEQGQVKNVHLQGDKVRGELAKTIEQQQQGKTTSINHFTTYIPAFGDTELLELLRQNNVDISVEPKADSSFWVIVGNLLPFLLLFVIGYFILRSLRSQGQGIFSLSQNQAKLYEKKDGISVTFNDVAGAEEAKRELKEVVEFLKTPKRFHDLGARTPKGFLLVGPPGSGKTLLARAVAGEANVPFYSITGSDFMQMFVGVGASRVRNMFRDAKAKSPAIIFIDELDSIGRERGTGLGGGHDEREQTLNQLLSELDGFEPAENIIVMAATNRPDVLDPALLRPGRFDRKVTVNLPTQKERLAILKVHARNKKINKDVSLESVTRAMRGASGADLEQVLNEAALLAARQHKTQIEENDIEQARDKLVLGLRREGLVITPEENELIAYHESGHALTSALLPYADPVQKISIIPREHSMGVTQQLPETDRYVYRKEYMLDRLAVMMGGRAAEQLIFYTLTTGAADDLKEATRLARQMVLKWGMSEKLGPMVPERGEGNVFLGKELGQGREYSDATAQLIDEEVHTILENAFKRATQTLKNNRSLLDTLAKTLQQKEEMSGQEILTMVETHTAKYQKTSNTEKTAP